jgi:hypothetical protein
MTSTLLRINIEVQPETLRDIFTAMEEAINDGAIDWADGIELYREGGSVADSFIKSDVSDAGAYDHFWKVRFHVTGALAEYSEWTRWITGRDAFQTAELVSLQWARMIALRTPGGIIATGAMQQYAADIVRAMVFGTAD